MSIPKSRWKWFWICLTIERAEHVPLSNFGIFRTREKTERPGRKTRTGEEVPILRRRVVTFKTAALLKDRAFHAHRARNDQKKSKTRDDLMDR
ncbi:HU family DNA-binding protein [Pararhizobium sp. DWP3-4]|uniref:HU family DNA-binding protein n=1 Tax=Pararhizobium sp. DWP3-4 TaxID=2804565 RepID=UPI003CE74AD1